MYFGIQETKNILINLKKNDAWDKIVEEVSPEATVDECKKKMFSLLAFIRLTHFWNYFAD